MATAYHFQESWKEENEILVAIPLGIFVSFLEIIMFSVQNNNNKQIKTNTKVIKKKQPCLIPRVAGGAQKDGHGPSSFHSVGRIQPGEW